ncbi:heavy metal translocating P-type ATPase [Gottschalkiaceae bacterium SANA]|nr:heavy metal translocating P-type ATPase [Gottschalkiaceae bacterium SANA]
MIVLKLEGLNCAGCAGKIQTLVSKMDDVKDAKVNLAMQKIEIEAVEDAELSVIEEATKIVLELEPHVKVYPINKKRQITLYLNGLHCAGCAAKIESALQKHEKLSNVSFSFATKRLQFETTTDKPIIQQMIQAIVDRIEKGVTVEELPSEKKNVIHTLPNDITAGGELVVEAEEATWMKFYKKHGKTILGSGLLFVAVVIPMPKLAQLTAYAIAYLLIGGDIVLRAVKNLLRGQLFDENFLMTLATVGAFALGEYTEAVAVMLFYKVGEGFQDYAVDHSRRSIQSLLNIKAEYANLLVDGSTRKVIPEALSLGDIILIRAGEKVPVDGVIIDGQSTMNTSALTGESMPRRVEKEDEILSGAINLDASLTVRVSKIFENSTVARILDMVENATSKKAKTEQFITKFARIYTPIVVVSAVLLAVLPPLMGGGDFREWASRALIFLVISCPCALVLSVPLGFFGGLGAASRKGILLKGGNYLEALNTIDTFVFDKTGTLTKGNFAVQKTSGEETLKLAAFMEVHSTHPIGQSILKAYGEDQLLESVEDVREIPGEGLVGCFEEKQLLVGNERLMKRYEILLADSESVGTIVHVALDGVYTGAIQIADEIKPGIENLVINLKASGAKEVIMLTGDQKQLAEKVADTLKIDRVFSELLPQDKMNHVEALIAEGRKVLFVGDGINDAPVLARADLGVAMGGLGSDAAIEAADMVLMTDEPMKLLEAKRIAKKTRRIVMQNIIFALGVKGFFLALGAMGVATMYEAIFADVGVAIIAVLNSMRVMKV